MQIIRKMQNCVNYHYGFMQIIMDELTLSLWLYSIHSKNAEVIHLLELDEVPHPYDL